MAKKQKAFVKAKPEPEAAEAEPVSPDSQIVLHTNGQTDDGRAGDSYALVPKPEGWNRDRTVFVDGVHYEHVAEDEADRWVYRRC